MMSLRLVLSLLVLGSCSSFAPPYRSPSVTSHAARNTSANKPLTLILTLWQTLMTNMGKWATWWAEQEGTKLGRYGSWDYNNIRILGEY